MSFGAPRSRNMSHHHHYTIDNSSAAVLSAWENSQHAPAFHRTHTAPEALVPGFGYRPKGFAQYPISPVSPVSSMSSSPSSMVFASASSPSSTSSTLSEYDMLRSMNFRADVTPVTRHCGSSDFDFDFNFLPDLNHSSLTLPARASLPTPPPTSPTSSDGFAESQASAQDSAVTESSSATSSTSSKRTSATSTGTTSKRTRTCISTKDFVPPDVTGLSKREARLVKNRAAAFLSRQRKREEFEVMEIRVGELEQENERLRAIVEGRPSPARSSSEDSSSADSQELEQLRAQLSLAKDREAELMRRLEASINQVVKAEPCDPTMSDTSSAASSPTLGPTSLVDAPIAKSTVSLGLMALLCALPSILSKSSSGSALPSSQSMLDGIHWDAPDFFPTSTGPTSTLGCNFDWAEPSLNAKRGDMELDHQASEPASNGDWKKLELEGDDGLEVHGLGSLDISFNTAQTKDGKVRVRIHSSVGASLPKAGSASPTVVGSPEESLTLPLGLPSPASDAAFPSFSFPSHDSNADIPAADLHSNPFSAQYSQAEPFAQFFGMPSSPFDIPECQNVIGASHRRLRIALKNLPQPGCEGGEWEVEVR